MNVPAQTATTLPCFSVKHALQFAVQFAFRGLESVWPRVLLPMTVGGLTLYGTLYLYLLEFERYLELPNDRVGSLVLGVASAGLLLTFFLHSVTMAAITSLALGREDQGWKYFCISRRAWRTYAAYLRFLLLCVAFTAAVEVARNLLDRMWGGVVLNACAELGLFTGLAILVVRAGLLISSVAAASDKGQVVRQSWRLSSTHFWKLAIIMFVIVLPSTGVEAICERAVRFLGVSVPEGGNAALVVLVANYRTSLPAILFAIGIAYAICVVLLVSASASAYRQIAARADN